MPTKIEWVRNPDGTKGETWPVVTGCTPCSIGCTNCYAARLAATRLKHHPRYAGLAEMRGGRPRWTGEVRLNRDVLGQPLRWRKPRMVFPCSMSDLFHKSIKYDFLDEIFDTIGQTPHHTYQILTKRPRRMLDFVTSYTVRFGWAWTGSDDEPKRTFADVFPNVWLGVTIENQDEMWRLEHLINTPAAVRFVSHEPLLSAIDYTAFPIGPRDASYGKSALELGLIHWLIVGGETGPNARPMHPDWARSLRDQCQVAGVPFFFKNWGKWLPECQEGCPIVDPAEEWIKERRGLPTANFLSFGDGSLVISIPKSRCHRLLDGVDWSEMP